MNKKFKLSDIVNIRSKTKYVIEGNNNFIKVLKRIAFGFRSFRRFKARIMICKGLIKINRKKASAFALTS